MHIHVRFISADTDTSLSFIVKDIKNDEFTVEYNDTGDCITGTRTYEVRVNGEVYDVQEQDDPQTINSGVDLPPCVEMEFVFTRYVDGVQVGQALSETSRTYQGETYLLSLRGFHIYNYYV